MEGDSICVAARLRPLVGAKERQLGSSAWSVESKSVRLENEATGSSSLNFDTVFSPEATNAQVYSQVGKRVVDRVLAGYNGTILAYGQTGSGKTHTIFGTERSKDGVAQMALQDLLAVSQRRKTLGVRFRVSYLEIYKEKIFDLLDDSGSQANGTGGPQSGLKISREDPILGVVIKDLYTFDINSVEQAMALLSKGDRARHSRTTRMNERSSRSHAVFRVHVESQPVGDKPGYQSCLNLVDLAGSERQGYAKVDADLLCEGSNINKSLLALREVISGLAKRSDNHSDGGRKSLRGKNSRSFVPYRNSKLTRVLRQALGGNALTTLICTASICAEHEQESLNSFRFGLLCKKVKNEPSLNPMYTNTEELIQGLRREITSLRERLREQQYYIDEKVDGERASRVSRHVVRKSSLDDQCEIGSVEGKEDLKGLGQENEPSCGDQQWDAHERLQQMMDEQATAIEAWENEMQAWYEQSKEYHYETEERARQVEQYAKQLEMQKKAARQMELVLKDERVSLDAQSKDLEELERLLQAREDDIDLLQRYQESVTADGMTAKERTNVVGGPKEEGEEEEQEEEKFWRQKRELAAKETQVAAALESKVEQERKLAAKHAALCREQESLLRREQKLIASESKLAERQAAALALHDTQEQKWRVATLRQKNETKQAHDRLVQREKELALREAKLRENEAIILERERQLSVREAELAQARQVADLNQRQEFEESRESLLRREQDLALEETRIEEKRLAVLKREQELSSEKAHVEQIEQNAKWRREEQVNQIQAKEEMLQREMGKLEKHQMELHAKTKTLSEEESEFARQKNQFAENEKSHELRVQLLRSREKSFALSERRVRSSSQALHHSLRMCKMRLGVLEKHHKNAENQVIESVREILSQVDDNFAWLDSAFPTSPSESAFLQAASDFAAYSPRPPYALHASPNSASFRTDPSELERLAKTLSDILSVSIPIIADPQHFTPKDLATKRRLLSRHLSEAKLILTASLCSLPSCEAFQLT